MGRISSFSFTKLLALTFVISFISPSAFTQIWVGNNSVGDFTIEGNWENNTQPAWSSGSDLIFKSHNNAAQTSLYYNYPEWRPVRSIIYGDEFLPLISPYPLNSNNEGFDIYWKIENYSTVAQQIRMPLSIKGEVLELNPVNGDLILDHDFPLYNDDKKDINVWGFHMLVLGNQIYGDNNTRLILQRDEFNNSNHYPIVVIQTDMKNKPFCFSGGVIIKAGELWFDDGGSLNGDSIYIGSTSYTAKVFLNALEGDQNITNDLIVQTGATMSHIGGLNTSGTNIYSGKVTLNESTSLESRSGGIVMFSGDITGPADVHIRPVDESGAIIQYFGAAKSYTGTTYIENGATLKISSNQTLSSIALRNGGKLIVDDGVTLTITGSWTGGGTLENNGTIILNGPDAFPGATTTVTAMNNLNLDKTGFTALDAPLTIQGSYLLADGILNLGDNNLTFETTATIGGNIPSATNMIRADSSGKVVKSFSSPGAFTYPIGDASDYSPASINLSAVTESASIGINVVNSSHPQNSAASSYIHRYWRVTATGIYTGDASFAYLQADVAGTESDMITAGWNGTSWNLYGSVNTGLHTLETSGQSDLNRDFTAGDKFSPVASLPDNYFRSNASGDWNIAANWKSSPTGTGNWEDATLAPTGEARRIDILSEHHINITNHISLNNTKVYGKLSLLTNGKIDIPYSGEDGIRVKENGTFETATTNNYTSSITFPISASFTTYPVHVETNGTVAINKPATGTAGNGYEGLAGSEKNKWDDKSKFVWNNGLSYALGTGTNSVTYFPTADANTIPYFVISTPVNNGSGGLTTINGLTIVNAATTMSGTGNKEFRNGIAGNATLTQDGGTNNPGNFQITGSNAILGGENLTLNLTDILNIDSDTQVPADSVVIINNDATAGKILKAGAINFTVNGTADMTTINMSNGSGSVSINGHLKTASPDGIKNTATGAVPTFGGASGGVVNVNTGSTIEYNAGGNQSITSSNTLSGTAPYYHLVLSGGGTKTPVSAINIDVSGSLKISGTTTIVDATLNNIGPNNAFNTTTLIMDAGRFKMGTLGYTGSGTMPVMKGAYSLTGGVIEFAGGTPAKTQSIRSGSGYNYFNIEVSGSYVSTSGGNVNIKDGGSFVVKHSGNFTVNINSIKGVNTPGTAFVEVENGGIFNTGNIGGFNGRASSELHDTTSSIHSNLPDIRLNDGSTVIYSRSNPPLTGDGSQPITTGNFSYQNLTLSGTGNKIAPPETLVVNGDFTKSAGVTFLHNSGNVEFNSSSSQTVSASAPYPLFYDLTNNNTSSLKVQNDILVKNTLTLGDHSTINLSGDITLISDASGTASVSKIPEDEEAATITYGDGRFIVERYIPAHSKAWQLLSVPTRGSTILESWQNSKYEITGRGVNITAPFANWSERGFDAKSYAPSMKYYVPESDGYTGVERTDQPIDLHGAYFLFVRGDRTVTDVNADATEVTIHTKGKIYEPGNPHLPVILPAGKWSLIGNPYASAIDFNKLRITGANVETDYYIWDPQLTTDGISIFGLGAYRKITSDGNGGWIAVPTDENYPDDDYPPIQSGQGFFIYNTGPTEGQVSFSEDAKVPGSFSIFRKGKDSGAVMKIRTNLYLTSSGNNVLLDGTLQLFKENYSKGIDQYDSKKIMNSGENIALPSEKYPLIVERRSVPEEGDTSHFSVTGMGMRNYMLQVKVSNLNAHSLRAILNDHYTGTQYRLDEGSNEYSFTVDNNKLSAATNRFYITYKNTPPPFAFTNETITADPESVRLSWQTISGHLANEFVVESGSDSLQLAPVKSLAVGTDAEYRWTHYPPADGVKYYRIQARLHGGDTAYSKILKTTLQFPTASIALYPNPAIQYTILKLTRQPEGKYSIRLFDAAGKLVLSKDITHKGSGTHEIKLDRIAKGIYHVDITGPGGLRYVEKLAIE